METAQSPKFANPGRNCRINLYPHSIPQCHESCLLGPAENRSSAFTQLHSSTATAAGNQAEEGAKVKCRAAEMVPHMVVPEGTRILLAALLALMRANTTSGLGCSHMRVPPIGQQRCRVGLLRKDQDLVLIKVKELPAAPANQMKSPLHSLGDKLTLLRVPGPVVRLITPRNGAGALDWMRRAEAIWTIYCVAHAGGALRGPC